MPIVKLKIFLVDKRRIFPLKAKYDTDTRLATVRLGLRRHFPTKFQVNPEHLYEQRRGAKAELVCFVDNASRKSMEVAESHAVETAEQLDGKMKNVLDYLIEEKFWRSLIAKTKLPLSTILITLCAGGGLFYLIRDILIPIFTGGKA
ncbi:MAG: hypothetical protein QXX34_03490 [Candidatus Bathyarchaeia archaeon]